MRSKFAAIGAILYLLAFACAYVYPLFSHKMFSVVFVALLALPWSEYLPSGGLWLWAAPALNALVIYFLLAALAWLCSSLRRLAKS